MTLLRRQSGNRKSSRSRSRGTSAVVGNSFAGKGFNRVRAIGVSEQSNIDHRCLWRKTKVNRTLYWESEMHGIVRSRNAKD